jgi:hypothetical protein
VPPHDREIDRLIGLYREIESASKSMLTWALDGEWDQVSLEQDRCLALIHSVRTLNQEVQLDGEAMRTKLQIMREILRNEAFIRRLNMPWTVRIEREFLAPRKPPLDSASIQPAA